MNTLHSFLFNEEKGNKVINKMILIRTFSRYYETRKLTSPAPPSRNIQYA